MSNKGLDCFAEMHNPHNFQHTLCCHCQFQATAQKYEQSPLSVQYLDVRHATLQELFSPFNQSAITTLNFLITQLRTTDNSDHI